MLSEPEHVRTCTSFDDLLTEPLTSDSDSDHEPAEPEGILGQEDCDEVDLERFPTVPIPQPPPSPTLRRRAFFIRTLALLCACSLSIGSHYASYILGPLKSRLGRELGTSHTEFSLLISAYSLNSTWTPLVGGILASRLGTTVTSILATGVILLGQALLLLGDIWGNVRLMTLGLFVFGLGVSPLAVVQETIIVRFFKSHGLGVSMAFGLIAGKGASFISARTTYPLTEKFGGRAPFYVATSLAAFSVIINLVYISSSKWLIQESGAELEAPDIAEEARRRSISNMSEAQALEKVAAKRRVNFRQMTKLGDVFWAYIGLNVLCGMIWSPFTHLAANIIEKRYMLSEESAANQASYLLAGSLILYPICGFLVDRMKHRPIVIQLLLLSSTLTMIAYAWFAAPPSWTQSPTPGIAAFASGHGFSPLLLVVLVPKIVPLKYVSTALGAHKSLEQTGSTIFQTLAGLSLDNDMKHKGLDHKNYKPSKPNTVGVQHLLNIFLFLNVLQFLSILWLAYFQRRKSRAISHHARAGSTDVLEAGVGQLGQRPSETPDAQQPLLGTDNHQRYSSTDASRSRSRTRPSHDEHKSRSEVRRGEICASVCGILILSAWILFFGTAWFRLGSRKDVH